jgi:hypothetical protein
MSILWMRMKDKDPYPKPATAREAALSLVRSAIAVGRTPEELIAGGYGIYRPDYNAVVGRVFGANPRREIRPDEVGVLGFDARREGVVFAVADLWAEAEAEAERDQAVTQERLF